ncbi:hypothetical protein MRB53_009745 [Persea americana]|uniref:Uncharacterized protein n=1 Tax=Persea americana TaxID=3435 RepID=A0ACC2LQL7_PERAE|nr:hypothetical protein MRB53_009745 [Persea americana]
MIRQPQQVSSSLSRMQLVSPPPAHSQGSLLIVSDDEKLLHVMRNTNGLSQSLKEADNKRSEGERNQALGDPASKRCHFPC